MNVSILQREFCEQLPTIGRIINRRIRRLINLGVHLDRVEARQNAIAWTWVIYCRQRGSAATPEKAAAVSAYLASRRGRPMGSSTSSADDRGRDPLDHRESVTDSVLLSVPDREHEVPPDGDAEPLIGTLPENCQPAARLLAAGLSKVDVAARLGVSPSYVSRRLDDMRLSMGWEVPHDCTS